MAKSKVHPEAFRVGYNKPWNLNIKLINYTTNYHVYSNLYSFYQNYWYTKTIKKHYPNFVNLERYSRFWEKTTIKRKIPLIPLRTSNMFQHGFLRRRRYVLVNMLYSLNWNLTQLCAPSAALYWKSYFPETLAKTKTIYHRNSRLKNAPEFPTFSYEKLMVNVSEKNKNYIKKLPKFQEQPKPPRTPFSKMDKNLTNFGCTLNWQRNILMKETLKWQKYIPTILDIQTYNGFSGIIGSTPLRSYQYSIKGIIPPKYMFLIKIHKMSFLKKTAYVLSSLKSYKGLPKYYLFLSQLNIALHWKSSYVISILITKMIAPWQQAFGFLNFFKQILYRIHIERFNIRGIYINVKGSFGKTTRTQTLRIKPPEGLSTLQLQRLDERVSYSITQLKSIRGVLSMKVWLVWTV